MDPVSHLRASLLPILQAWEQELRREYPDVTTNICDWSVGKLTDWNGHNIGVECIFKNVTPEWPDNLALLVSLKHLHETPSLILLMSCGGTLAATLKRACCLRPLSSPSSVSKS
jgi:hypothetical protein